MGTFPNDPGFVASGADASGPLRLISGVGDHALIWNLDVETWPGIACLAAGRNLAQEEWEQFGPTGEPYQRTCPQWPAGG